MNLFLNKLFFNIPNIQAPNNDNLRSRRAVGFKGLEKDVFQKSEVHNISFTGNKSSGSTSKGDVLKELDNITCPYSGVKLISPKRMDRLERTLAKCSNIHERMEILEPYKNSMQELEKEVFTIFRGYEISNPGKTMNDCLNELKPDCLAELRMAELKVLDDVDLSANKFDAKTALKVRKITTKARQKIIEDKQDSIFKRKDLLVEIHDITKDYPDQTIVAEMWAKANKLPKSTNDFNAFVVKYANRSPQEIAARLLKPSLSTVEHIKPANRNTKDIEQGADDLTNFMVTARDWNSGRSNTPLPEFIKRHPNIPKYSQRYIEDIIRAIHKGKLKDCNWYPYVIKERLYNESQGLIDLNLDKYQIDIITALNSAPKDVIATYNNLLEEKKSIVKLNPDTFLTE